MKQFIAEIIRAAGQETLKFFGKVGVKYTKRNPADVVTEADLLANQILVESIREAYPNHGIISEETGEERVTSEYVWYIDPLDGTRNYSTRTPFFCTMVGLARNGEMILSAVYDPSHDELFLAEKGQGAFLNGERVQCAQTREFEHSFGTFHSNWHKERGHVIQSLLNEAQKQSFWISITASHGLTLTSVACGRRDWGFSLDCQIWDIAAPSLILREAGCSVLNLQGEEWSLGERSFVTANPALLPKLLELTR